MQQYFFDKRVIKKFLIKYGIRLLIIFPVLILVNYGLREMLQGWGIILADVFIAFGILLLIELAIAIFKNLKKKKTENVVVIKNANQQKTSDKQNNIKKETIPKIKILKIKMVSKRKNYGK